MSEAWVEAAAKALFEDQCPMDLWGAPMEAEERDSWREGARLVVLAALPLILGSPHAYETVTPTDDPDVFDAKLWAAAPGMVIPEGAIKLYAPSLGEGHE